MMWQSGKTGTNYLQVIMKADISLEGITLEDRELSPKVAKLYDFLQANQLVDEDNNQWFNTHSIYGDPMETLYSEDGVTLDYCALYGYFEVFGLTEEEFIQLKYLFGIEPECSFKRRVSY